MEVNEKTDDYLLNLTINGFQCDGLIFRDLEASPVRDDLSSKTNDSSGTIDSSRTTSDGSRAACPACFEVFNCKEVLTKHLDEIHFDPCPICERVFYRSVEKRAHIANDHDQSLNNSNVSEQNFHMNIQRQSTLNKTKEVSKINVQYIGDICSTIKDMKKRRMGNK